MIYNNSTEFIDRLISYSSEENGYYLLFLELDNFQDLNKELRKYHRPEVHVVYSDVYVIKLYIGEYSYIILPKINNDNSINFNKLTYEMFYFIYDRL